VSDATLSGQLSARGVYRAGSGGAACLAWQSVESSRTIMPVWPVPRG